MKVSVSPSLCSTLGKPYPYGAPTFNYSSPKKTITNRREVKKIEIFPDSEIPEIAKEKQENRIVFEYEYHREEYTYFLVEIEDSEIINPKYLEQIEEFQKQKKLFEDASKKYQEYKKVYEDRQIEEERALYLQLKDKYENDHSRKKE